ncbi:MAG: o-succinylbenzoate synthase [Bdellovibrionota bacterium]
MKETLKLYRYDLPLRKPIVIGSKTLRRRQGLLVSLTENPSFSSWGEIAPLPGYSNETLVEAEVQSIEILKNWTALRLNPDFSKKMDSWHPSVSFGFSSLFENRIVAQSDLKIARLLSGTSKEILDQAHQIYLSHSACTLKVKIGERSPSEEASLIWAISEKFRGSPLRLDVNRRWNLSQALSFAMQIKNCPIEFMEEPVDRFEDINTFVNESQLNVALDESLRRGQSAVQSIQATHWIIKPTVLGSHTRIRNWIAAAEVNQIQPILSSLYETGVGTFHLLQLNFLISAPNAIGLDPYSELRSDILEVPLYPPFSSEISINQLPNRLVPCIDQLQLVYETHENTHRVTP